MTNYYGIILAAGKGTRMKSDLYKVLHPVCGKPMVAHVVDQVKQAGATELVTIVGHGAERVKSFLGDQTKYALQAEQLGTGHAVLQAEQLLAGKDGVTLVVCGDTPLLKAETLAQLISVHEQSGAKATILTAHVDNPTGYGRVVRDQDGSVLKNVEQKDASSEELRIQEINTGTYCFDNALLFNALKSVTNNNAQGEYYLPDVIQILKERGEMIAAYQMDDVQESLGVNDRVALAQAEQLMRLRINEEHMRNGVSFIDPAATYIEASVTIGNDTTIEPGVVLKGNTKIGSRCFIGAQSVIRDAVIEDDVTVLSSAIEESTLKQHSDVGPFGHVRPGSVIGEHVHIGNFVEVKNATLGQNTKVGHLTYVGDADLGKDINIGCGTIFVNYDGKNKFRSTVKDHVFVGCNANIIAPVEIGEHAYIAAGSTITKNVPADALAIARVRQENKEDYVQHKQ